MKRRTTMHFCASTAGLAALIALGTAQRTAAAPAEAAPGKDEASASNAVRYRADSLRSPFQPAQTTPIDTPQSSAQPDAKRQKGPLEQFALEELAMIGTLSGEDDRHALIADPAGTVHLLAEGDYLGKAHGRIASIAEGEISLLETIRDGGGGWRQRPRSLTLEAGNETATDEQPTPPLAVEATQSPLSPTSSTSSAPSEQAASKRLTMNFQDIEIRRALQLIADFVDVNLVASETVVGNMTLRLVDVPWQEALQLILVTNGLEKRSSGEILLVAQAEEMAARDQLALENRKTLADLAPLQTEFYEVRYADAGELAALLAGVGVETAPQPESAVHLSPIQPLIQPPKQQTQPLTQPPTQPPMQPEPQQKRGRVLVDERTNSLILTDTAANIGNLLATIAQLDVPIRQVQIEARIVNANNTFSDQLGIRWGVAMRNQGVAILSPPEDAETTTNSYASADDLQATASAVADGGIVAQADVAGMGFWLDMELAASEAAGQAQIVARPKVVTTNKRVATIESGVEIPYQQSTKSGATSIAFKDAVLQLQVTPRITPNGRIVMDLEVKQDTVGRIYYGVPSINTTRIATQVLVNDGDTVVLGGIYQTDRHHTVAQTPVLGKVPVLGRAFRRTTERDDQQELFIFITPSIVQET